MLTTVNDSFKNRIEIEKSFVRLPKLLLWSLNLILPEIALEIISKSTQVATDTVVISKLLKVA